MLNWAAIDTVLLDMDGTLLDLHYDNYFWGVFLYEHYATLHNLSLAEAKQRIDVQLHQVASTLDWYCIDYWAEQLQLPIETLKTQFTNKIRYRPDAPEFLEQLHQANKQVALVTNAHPKTLAIKNQTLTGSDSLLTLCPQQFSTHDFGFCKEEQAFWQAFHQAFPFDPAKTLFIDDSERILDSAKQFGIQYTLGVALPDTTVEPKTFQRHAAITHFSELFPIFSAQRVAHSTMA